MRLSMIGPLLCKKKKKALSLSIEICQAAVFLKIAVNQESTVWNQKAHALTSWVPHPVNLVPIIPAPVSHIVTGVVLFTVSYYTRTILLPKLYGTSSWDNKRYQGCIGVLVVPSDTVSSEKCFSHVHHRSAWCNGPFRRRGDLWHILTTKVRVRRYSWYRGARGMRAGRT